MHLYYVEKVRKAQSSNEDKKKSLQYIASSSLYLTMIYLFPVMIH